MEWEWNRIECECNGNMKNRIFQLFSSFPQDAEISAFELRNILNKVMAKRKYLPPAVPFRGHEQVSSTAMRAQTAALTWAESNLWALPQTSAWLSTLPRPDAVSALLGGCACAEGVFHRTCALAGCTWVPFIPAAATGNWLPGRGMDLINA